MPHPTPPSESILELFFAASTGVLRGAFGLPLVDRLNQPDRVDTRGDGGPGTAAAVVPRLLRGALRTSEVDQSRLGL